MCRKVASLLGHALQLVQKCQTLKSGVDCLGEGKTRYDFKNGGRSRNRTYDLAPVRNVITKEKLLKLFAKFLLEATAGGDEDP